MLDRDTDLGWFLISFPTLCFNPSSILLTKIFWLFPVESRGGVSRREVLTEWMLHELVLHPLGLGDGHSWLFSLGRDVQRAFINACLASTVPVKKANALFCLITYSSLLIPGNQAIQLHPLWGEPFSLLQEAPWEVPKVIHSSAYHPWCTSGPVGLLRGLLLWESLFGNTELHLCVLSFVLPVSFSGMITSLLPQHPIPPSVTLEEIQRFFLNSLVLKPRYPGFRWGTGSCPRLPLARQAHRTWTFSSKTFSQSLCSLFLSLSAFTGWGGWLTRVVNDLSAISFFANPVQDVPQNVAPIFFMLQLKLW